MQKEQKGGVMLPNDSLPFPPSWLPGQYNKCLLLIISKSTTHWSSGAVPKNTHHGMREDLATVVDDLTPSGLQDTSRRKSSSRKALILGLVSKPSVSCLHERKFPFLHYVCPRCFQLPTLVPLDTSALIMVISDHFLG